MKWILYAVSAVAIFLGIFTIVAGVGVSEPTDGIILLLIGTTSFGFAVVAGKLDALARSQRSS